MDEKALALLRATLEDRSADLERLFAQVAGRRASFAASAEGVDSLAYRLHNLYGAFEQLFQEIAAAFGNHLEPDRYRTDLLRRMKLEIPGVRPALLSPRTFELLDELRRFRHLFRHAYAADLDSARVGDLAGKALALREAFGLDRERFLSRLAP